GLRGAWDPAAGACADGRLRADVLARGAREELARGAWGRERDREGVALGVSALGGGAGDGAAGVVAAAVARRARGVVRPGAAAGGGDRRRGFAWLVSALTAQLQDGPGVLQARLGSGWADPLEQPGGGARFDRACRRYVR